jgi:hypothetical protein
MRLRDCLLALVPLAVLALLVAATAAVESLSLLETIERHDLVQGIVAAWIVAVWNLLVVYLAPVAIAILFLILGTRRRWNLNALMIGGAAVCVIGGFVDLDVLDIPSMAIGTAYVDVGFVSSTTLGIVRAVVNLVAFGVVAFLFIPRRE